MLGLEAEYLIPDYSFQAHPQISLPHYNSSPKLLVNIHQHMECHSLLMALIECWQTVHSQTSIAVVQGEVEVTVVDANTFVGVCYLEAEDDGDVPGRIILMGWCRDRLIFTECCRVPAVQSRGVDIGDGGNWTFGD